MPIQLDHLIVPARDKAAGARFLAEVLNVPWEPGAPSDTFAPVYLNDGLTLDFAAREQFASHHYCFRVTGDEFDAIFDRIKARAIAYRSTPNGPVDMQINTRNGGKNLYWNDPDGHVFEVLTVSYARRPATVAT